jgi:hypothetical protein
MSQKKVKGVKMFLSIKEVKILEQLLASKAMMLGSFSKLKKSERDLWHTFDDICQDLKINNYKFEKKIDRSLN